MRSTSLLAAALLSLATTGCWARLSGGYAMSLNRGADAQGAAVNAEVVGRGVSSSLREEQGPYLVARRGSSGQGAWARIRLAA